MTEHARDRSIVDPASSDETVPPIRYNISSYGADFDVRGLVQRLKRGDIVIPSFERPFVWDQKMASQFIESLLLGLPVPGIFLAIDIDTSKYLVIDGQQRLKSLEYFYDGQFAPRSDVKPKTFSLTGVQSQFAGLTYSTLSINDQRRLDNSIIHATIVKPDWKGDNTSIIHLFERINSTGLALTVQEMRNALYHGTLLDLVSRLNENQDWRIVFGAKNHHLRDQELKTRFLALYFAADLYQQPMSEFINRFVAAHRNPHQDFLRECQDIFTRTIHIVVQSLGAQAFRPKKALNAAIFDSVMIGLAKRLKIDRQINSDRVKRAYIELLENLQFQEAIKPPLSNRDVKPRLELATMSFAEI